MRRHFAARNSTPNVPSKQLRNVALSATKRTSGAQRAGQQPTQSPQQPQHTHKGNTRTADATVKRLTTSELGCDHFHFCSGCTVENALGRPQLVTRARAFFQTLQLQESLALEVGPVHGWRCRAKLAVQSNPHGRPEIGLYKKDSHEVVPIPRCRTHHPRINQAVELIKQMTRQLGTPLCDHSSQQAARPGGSGGLRYVQLTAAARGGKAALRAEDDALAQIQVVLVWGADSDLDRSFGQCQALCQALWAYGGISSSSSTPGSSSSAAGSPGSPSSSSSTRSPPASLLHSVWVNFNSGDGGNAILGRGWRHMTGPTQLWQQFGAAQVCLAPGSFVQANYAAMQSAIKNILQYIPDGSRLVELHAGVGVIGLAAAAAGKLSHLRCVEVNGECAQPFAASQQALKQAVAVEFVVAAAGSSPAAFLADADVLVMDPPRKGLEAELLSELCSVDAALAASPSSPTPRRGGPHTLVYLSCGYDALERDLAALLASRRWRLDTARAILFFPGTNSLETLVVLRSTAQAASQPSGAPALLPAAEAV